VGRPFYRPPRFFRVLFSCLVSRCRVDARCDENGREQRDCDHNPREHMQVQGSCSGNNAWGIVQEYGHREAHGELVGTDVEGQNGQIPFCCLFDELPGAIFQHLVLFAVAEVEVAVVGGASVFRHCYLCFAQSLHMEDRPPWGVRSL
jgi:hypothetical protein